MVRIMTATQVKARILALLDDVATSGEDVVITKHGRPVARLAPAAGPRALKGALAGVAMSAEGDEDQLFHTESEWHLT